MSNVEKFNDKKDFLKEFESLRPDLFLPESWSEQDKQKVVEMKNELEKIKEQVLNIL